MSLFSIAGSSNDGDDSEKSIQNPSTIEKETAISTNTNTEDTSDVVIDPPVSQQLSEMNKVPYTTTEDTLDSKGACEESTSETQNINPDEIHEESFDVLHVDKLILNDISAASDDRHLLETLPKNIHNLIIITDTVFIMIQHSVNMHNESIKTETRRQTNIKTTTQMMLFKIKIIFYVKIYSNILNTYWFMNQPFDPGDVVSVKQAFGFICLTCTMGGGVRICHLYMLYRWTILLLVIILLLLLSSLFSLSLFF